MIGVNDLYLQVQQTLTKNQSGYFSGDDYNRLLILAQNDVFNFFMRDDGSEAFTHEALRPFLKNYSISISQPIALPADYRSKRSATVKYGLMIDGFPIFKTRTCDFLKNDEKDMTLESPVRGPSVANEVFLYTIDSSGINVYPQTLSGTFNMLYLRNPEVAVRAYNTDVLNEVETYNAAGSTDLEWGQEYTNIFHEVICFYQGIQLKDSEIVQWLMAKQNYDQGTND